MQGTVAGLGQLTAAPLYNLAPSPGEAAAFGISVNGNVLIERLRLIDAGAASFIRLDATVPPGLGIIDIDQQLWGVPALAGHDPQRTCQRPEGGARSKAAPPAPNRSPSSPCPPPARNRPRQPPPPPTPSLASPQSATAHFTDAGGNPRPLAGCESVPFDPRLALAPEAAALAPTGLTVELEVPSYEGAHLTAAAPLCRRRDRPADRDGAQPGRRGLALCLLSVPGRPDFAARRRARRLRRIPGRLSRGLAARLPHPAHAADRSLA